MLTKFPDEIRADLHEYYGVDIRDLFRESRFKHLLALIDQLPSHSRFYDAYMNDEEVALKIIEERRNSTDEEADEPWTPPRRGWTTEADLLATLIDSIQGLQATVQTSAGGKLKHPPTPHPRPTSKATELAEEQDKENAKERATAAYEEFGLI